MTVCNSEAHKELYHFKYNDMGFDWRYRRYIGWKYSFVNKSGDNFNSGWTFGKYFNNLDIIVYIVSEGFNHYPLFVVDSIAGVYNRAEPVINILKNIYNINIKRVNVDENNIFSTDNKFIVAIYDGIYTYLY